MVVPVRTHTRSHTHSHADKRKGTKQPGAKWNFCADA